MEKLGGDISFSTATLKKLKEVVITGNRLVTIENLTAFHDYRSNEEMVLYLGGCYKNSLFYAGK